MSSIFEELMKSNRQLTEGFSSRKSRKNESVKKISPKKIRLESRKVFEDADLDELDSQFAVDPEESQDDEVVLVIDPELPSDEEVPEDAAEQMVGDYVYKCPVCGGNYVCNCDAEKNESLELDDEGVPVECPICGDDAEQILVGEIAPAEGAGEEKEMEPVDSEDADDQEEVSDEDFIEEESVKSSSMKSEDVNIGGNDDGNSRGRYDDDEPVEEFLDIASPDIGLNVGGGVADILGGKKNEGLDGEVCPECGEEDCICGTESDIMTPVASSEEEAKPAVAIDAQVVNLNLDDRRFESLMNSVIKENYKNSNSFKITRVSASGSRLKVEYVVRGRGSKSRKGILVGEGFSPKSRRMKISFKDKGAFTESFGEKPSFVVECVTIRNNVIPTKVIYDYKVRVNESLYRVYGNVLGQKN